MLDRVDRVQTVEATTPGYPTTFPSTREAEAGSQKVFRRNRKRKASRQ
jgi:hypothetical protein